RIHLRNNFPRVRCRVNTQERYHLWINRKESVGTDEATTETINQCRRGANAPGCFEDLQDPRASLHGPDRIDDLEFRDGSLVVSEVVEEKPVQRGPKERGVARGYQDPPPSCDFEATNDPLDRPDTAA